MGTLGTGGSALLAQTYYILDLVIDAAGYIYFAEDSQPLLRRITPSGRVEVFAGWRFLATTLMARPLPSRRSGTS